MQDPFDDFKPGRMMAWGTILAIVYWVAIAAIILGGLKIAGVI